MKNDLSGLKFGKITVINYNVIKEYKCGTKDNLWKSRCLNPNMQQEKQASY